MNPRKSPFFKFNIVFTAFSVALISLIVLFFRIDSGINRSNLEFISSYRWQVEEKPVDISHITIPESFDPVFSAYSQIVAKDGFDLYSYRGKKATRYSYKVLNHKNSDTGMIRVNLLICDKTIIAADISSIASSGFILPISNDSGIL